MTRVVAERRVDEHVDVAATIEASARDDAFFEILRTRVAKQAGGHVTTDEFIDLAESISGQQLDELFQTWLFTPEKPPTLDAADAQVAAATAQLQQETSPARQLERVGSKH